MGGVTREKNALMLRAGGGMDFMFMLRREGRANNKQRDLFLSEVRQSKGVFCSKIGEISQGKRCNALMTTHLQD